MRKIVLKHMLITNIGVGMVIGLYYVVLDQVSFDTILDYIYFILSLYLGGLLYMVFIRWFTEVLSRTVMSTKQREQLIEVLLNHVEKLRKR